MEASQYEKEFQFAVAIAMAAGAKIVAASKERLQSGGGQMNDKKNRVDLVRPFQLPLIYVKRAV